MLRIFNNRTNEIYVTSVMHLEAKANNSKNGFCVTYIGAKKLMHTIGSIIGCYLWEDESKLEDFDFQFTFLPDELVINPFVDIEPIHVETLSAFRYAWNEYINKEV